MGHRRNAARKNGKRHKLRTDALARSDSDADQELLITNPAVEQAPAHIAANARFKFPVAQRDTHKGKRLAICGAGPSLANHYERLLSGTYDVWACNSALGWLVSRGVPITRGSAIEMSDIMLHTWREAPVVPYLLASCVHPHLILNLLQRGVTDIMMFHNFVGFGEREFKLYSHGYPETILAGMGLNVVNRLIQVGDYLGYDRIDVLGADCALGTEGAWHMDGSMAHPDRTMMTARINGRMWATFFDMAYSAVALVWQKRILRDRLRLVGDTMPAAILSDPRYKRNPGRFLKLLPSFYDGEGAEWEQAMRTGRVS